MPDDIGIPLLRGSERKDIPVIRRRLKNGEAQRVIALDYGVHQVTISRIKTGRDWSHVTIGGDLNGTD